MVTSPTEQPTVLKVAIISVTFEIAVVDCCWLITKLIYRKLQVLQMAAATLQKEAGQNSGPAPSEFVAKTLQNKNLR